MTAREQCLLDVAGTCTHEHTACNSMHKTCLVQSDEIPAWRGSPPQTKSQYGGGVHHKVPLLAEEL